MPKGHQAQAPADTAVVPEKPPIPDDARPIKDAPLTGEIIWLYNEQITHGIRGFWRKSRHYVKQRWVVNNYWADPMTRKPLAAIWTHWRPQ